MAINLIYTTSPFNAMFNAMPAPVFMVDGEVRIHHLNTAATEFLFRHMLSPYGSMMDSPNHRLNSEIKKDRWRMVFRRDACVVTAVENAIQGGDINRHSTTLDIHPEGFRTELEASIVYSPFNVGARTYVLLIFENRQPVDTLNGVIHICSVCHKVIDEKKTLTRLEAYAREYEGVVFSHGLCPECFKSEMINVEAFPVDEPKRLRSKVMTAWPQA